MESPPKSNPQKRADIGNAELADESQDHTDLWSRLRRRLFNLDEKPEYPDHGKYFSLDPDELERRAELMEFQPGGFADSEESLQQAAHLRELVENPESTRPPLLEKFYEQEQEIFPEVFYLCQRDEEMLNLLGDKTLKYCRHLALLAKEGNQAAAQWLGRVAILSTNSVGGILGDSSKALDPLIEQQFAWPMMASPHPFLGERRFRLEDLPLGKAFPFRISRSARFDTQTPSGKIAWKLWFYVFELRVRALEFAQERGITLATTPRTNAEVVTIPLAAALLPAFTSDSASVARWWELGKRCLVEAYPSNTDAGELDEAVPALSAIVSAESQKRTARELRGSILNKIEERFYSFAGFRRPKAAKS
jgi:hypothetical protein